jgi:hypothetical protein
MRINSQDNQGYLTIEPKERGLDGSLRLSIKVASHGFGGETTKIWIDKEISEVFVAELCKLEEKRQGKATLISMSPDECLIKVEVVDAVGHIGITVDLARPVFLFGRTVRQRVHTEFEMDAGRLRNIAKETKEIMNWLPTTA